VKRGGVECLRPLRRRSVFERLVGVHGNGDRIVSIARDEERCAAPTLAADGSARLHIGDPGSGYRRCERGDEGARLGRERTAGRQVIGVA